MAGDLIPYQGDLEPDEEYDSLEFDGASFTDAHAGNGHFLDCSFAGTSFDGTRLQENAVHRHPAAGDQVRGL